MSRKRNYFSEIEEIQSRMLRRANRWQQVVKRIHPLIKAFWEIKKNDFGNKKVKKEFARYIPIAAISIIEGWFRMAVSDLINRKSVCRKNAESLKEMKFELRDILHIHSRKGSVGDLIAHLLPVNKVGDIIEVLTIIIGKDFKELFMSVELNYEDRSMELANEAEDTFKILNKTFELRHIFVMSYPLHLISVFEKLEIPLNGCFYFLLVQKSLCRIY